MTFFLRNPSAVVVSHTKRLLFSTPTTETSVLQLEDAELLCALLQKASKPIAKEELLQFASADSLALLVEGGVLLEGTHGELSQKIAPLPLREKPCKHLVFGVSGAVSASVVHSFIVEALLGFCEEIDVILTNNAERFLQPNTLLYPRVRVWSELFSPKDGVSVPHIHLASLADLVLILPASANTIAKLAAGMCSDLLTLTVSATSAPVAVAPAMNGAMRRHPAISRNIDQLRRDGAYIIEPSFAWEMSNGPNSERELGGLGVEVSSIVQTLESILLAHQSS